MPIALFASISNTKDAPISVDSIAVSWQIKSGGWVKLRHVNTTAGDVYMMLGGALNDAGHLDLSGNGLDRLLLKPIGLHETVRGWMFFDTEQPSPLFEGDMLRYRWTFRDSTGEKYEMTTEFMPTNLEDTPGEAQFTRTNLIFDRAHIDLRSAGLKVKKWHDAAAIAVPNK